MGYSVSIWGKVSLMILGPRTPLHPKECQTLRPLRSQAPSWEASKEGVTVCSDRSSGSPGPPPPTPGQRGRARPPCQGSFAVAAFSHWCRLGQRVFALPAPEARGTWHARRAAGDPMGREARRPGQCIRQPGGHSLGTGPGSLGFFCPWALQARGAAWAKAQRQEGGRGAWDDERAGSALGAGGSLPHIPSGQAFSFHLEWIILGLSPCPFLEGWGAPQG